MLPTKAWIFGKLSALPGLLAVVGDASHISDMRPDIIEVFPMVIFTDEDQHDEEYSDNMPKASMQKFKIEIFSKLDLATTTAIATPIATFFTGLFFSCDSNGEVPDPVMDVRHRVLHFSRELFATNLNE
jgi:hypothetical protein